MDKTDTFKSIRFCHPANAYAVSLRAYIDTVLPALQCHMDVQTSDGHGMLLKYVSAYISKSHESYHKDIFYTPDICPSTAAIKYSLSLDICEPEVWVNLSCKKISWTNSMRKNSPYPPVTTYVTMLLSVNTIADLPHMNPCL